jgi:DNA-directed RNA polymerase subunit N (RpoN/RPB10)
MNDSEKDIDSIINITGCEILRQVLPSLKQFEAVTIRKQEIEELMKTTRGKLYPTITLLIASLKPYFKEEKLKNIKRIKEIRIEEKEKIEEEIFFKIKEEIIKNKIILIDKARKIKIEDLKALSNINNISKEEENRLRELGLIRYISRKAVLTHSGKNIFKIIKEII